MKILLNRCLNFPFNNSHSISNDLSIPFLFGRGGGANLNFVLTIYMYGHSECARKSNISFEIKIHFITCYLIRCWKGLSS